MLGYRLFKYSILLLLGNLSAILRLTTPVFVIYALIQLLIGWGLISSFASLQREFTPTAPEGMRLGEFLILIWSFIILGGILLIVIAINWHRYILLEGEGKSFGKAILWLYVKKTLKIMLAFIFTGMIALFLFVIFIKMQGMTTIFQNLESLEPGQPVSLPTHSPQFWLLPIVGSVLFLWLGHRISLCLPAAAIGKEMSVRESWRQTKQINGQILILASLETMLYFGISVVVSWVLTLIGAIPSTILSLLQTWILTLYSTSILTTLYGYLIENRPLQVARE